MALKSETKAYIPIVVFIITGMLIMSVIYFLTSKNGENAITENNAIKEYSQTLSNNNPVENSIDKKEIENTK